ncbi:hypothetical protein LINPERPRIM_LOCUS6317 [Linum perenne]
MQLRLFHSIRNTLHACCCSNRVSSSPSGGPRPCSVQDRASCASLRIWCSKYKG